RCLLSVRGCSRLRSFAFTKRSTNGATARTCNRKRRSLKFFQVIFAWKRAMKSSFIVLLLFANFSFALKYRSLYFRRFVRATPSALALARLPHNQRGRD